MSDFKTLITKMTKAACSGDGKETAACFTNTGTYHDCFYGAFEGKAIINMIEKFFHRDAENFIWDVHDPVDDGRIGYARYILAITQNCGRLTVKEWYLKVSRPVDLARD